MSGSMNTLTKSLSWQDPSKFRISMTGPGSGELDLPKAEILSSACQSIQVADITQTPIQEFIGEQWRFASGRLENYQIGITFKDYNNFELYRKFADGIQDFSRMYPDDQNINLEIYTSGTFDVDKFTKIAEFKDCLLIAVSGPTLDNSSVASVAEFTIQLKASYVKT